MNTYEIRVEGHLDLEWSEWLEGLTISHDGEGHTVLRGSLVDLAALLCPFTKEGMNEDESGPI